MALNKVRIEIIRVIHIFNYSKRLTYFKQSDSV